MEGAQWWSQTVPEESGRTAVRRHGTGSAVDVLPAPWNARSRVHEYGGGAWTAVGGRLVFVNFADQVVYLLREGLPVALTASSGDRPRVRFGDLVPDPASNAVLAVRERHDSEGVSRDIVRIPLDGSGAADEHRVRSLVSGSRFLAFPRLSPDGARLAWIAWDHPQMPWDGTELRVADRLDDGTMSAPRTLLGSRTESVLQPEWLDAGTLVVLSDRFGWWNPYRVEVAGSSAELIHGVAADIGGPLWVLGERWFALLPGQRLLAVQTVGVDRLVVIDLADGGATDVTPPGWERISLSDIDGASALFVSGGSSIATGLRSVDLDTGTVSDLEVDEDSCPPEELRPVAKRRVFPGVGGRDVHAFVYPPRNSGVEPMPGELPPYLVHVHGGPTGHAVPRVSDWISFWTSRGIGVVDVNYGGSSGYGRDYRERLRGRWGVVDVEDVVAVARGLAMSGDADPNRIAIDGGSAGGWTVLAALTTTDAFACGISHFGVADAAALAEHTHDFESRYLDGLIGPLPESRSVYDARSPLSNVERLSSPVLLLQGMDDPIVPPSQAETFRDALEAKGIPHAYIPFAGESHGFRRAETVTQVQEASLSFLGQVFGFEPEGVPKLQLAG